MRQIGPRLGSSGAAVDSPTGGLSIAVMTMSLPRMPARRLHEGSAFPSVADQSGNVTDTRAEARAQRSIGARR